MSAYLQRLLARAAPGASFALAPPSIPVAPLGSPLAAHDQRLGMPDFEAPVPSEFEEAKVNDADPAIEGRTRHPAGKAAARDTLNGRHRAPPELRLVVEKHGDPAEFQTFAGPVEASPEAPPGADVSALMPGPLDIGPGDLEPIRAPPAEEGDRSEQGQSAAPILEAEPAADPVAPIPDLEHAFDADLRHLPADAVDEAQQDRAIDLPLSSEPADRQIAPILPSAVDEPEQAPSPIALPLDAPEPAETRPTLPTPALEHADQEVGRPPAVSIEQIVIDVHEAQQAQHEHQLAARGRPVTAASASIIGPLPVRRSTVSLFGMRRR